MRLFRVLAVIVLSVLMSAPMQAQNGFEIKRGVNVSHWLSQSQARGQARANHIKDALNIVTAGFGAYSYK